jgi:hypothetical protein
MKQFKWLPLKTHVIATGINTAPLVGYILEHDTNDPIHPYKIMVTEGRYTGVDLWVKSATPLKTHYLKAYFQ